MGMTEDDKHEILRRLDHWVEETVARIESGQPAIFLLSVKLVGSVQDCKAAARQLVDVASGIIDAHMEDNTPLVIECNLTRWEAL